MEKSKLEGREETREIRERREWCPEGVLRDQMAKHMNELGALCGKQLVEVGWVYAIRHVGGALIKIGQSHDPLRRVLDLQSMNGAQLEIVGLSHFADCESMIHWNLDEHRAHGEWFWLSDNPLPIVDGICLGCRMSRYLLRLPRTDRFVVNGKPRK